MDGKNVKFPDVLKDLMAQDNLSISTVADETGISFNAIAQYRSGKTEPTLSKLETLADFFGVSVDFLIGRAEIASPSIDVQATAELLGLSESTITALSKMKDDMESPDDKTRFDAAAHLQAIDCGLASRWFREFLFWVSMVDIATDRAFHAQGDAAQQHILEMDAYRRRAVRVLDAYFDEQERKIKKEVEDDAQHKTD